jgi:hypothetical protein
MTVASVVVFNAAWPEAVHPTLTGVVLVGGDPSAQNAPTPTGCPSNEPPARHPEHLGTHGLIRACPHPSGPSLVCPHRRKNLDNT